MAARVFHFIRSARPSVTTAECGARINTKRDHNWSDNIDGTSCKRCLARIKKQGINTVMEKKGTPADTQLLHFVENAGPRKVRAACGEKIKTERDTNYTVQRDGVTCTVCLEAMQPKRKKDKPAIRRLEKMKRHADKYLVQVSDAGTGSRSAPNKEQALRIKLAEDLSDVLDAMISNERNGWTKTT